MDPTIPAAVAGLLGLARRAGSLAIGARATRRAAAQGALDVIVIASDASPRTVRQVRHAAEGTPVATVGSMASLGAAVGSAPVAVLGLRRGPLAAQVRRILERSGQA